MVRITVDVDEVIMLATFKRMRQIVKSKASPKHKQIALNEAFYRAMDMLDISEGRKRQ